MSTTLDSVDASLFEPPPQAVKFYRKSLKLLQQSGIPFLLSGTYALGCYTGMTRPTKDLDVFCKVSDGPRILAFFRDKGYEIEIEDERWIGKVWSGKFFFDVIWNISSASIPVNEDWFEQEYEVDVYGTTVRVTPPTEFILSKLFIQTRYRYDGADVAHTILKKSEEIDWKRLLNVMELYWEVLLIHLLNFRFIYPTRRELIPRWLFDELMDRLRGQADLPAAGVEICRGRLLSPRDYIDDITLWGFADVVGKGIEDRHESTH